MTVCHYSPTLQPVLKLLDHFKKLLCPLIIQTQRHGKKGSGLKKHTGVPFNMNSLLIVEFIHRIHQDYFLMRQGPFFLLVSDSSYYMDPVPMWTHWYLPVSEQLCSRSWGGVRHRFVYVLKPTSRARRESHMSTQIPKHRIRFHRDISHYCLLWALSLLCVLVIS